MKMASHWNFINVSGIPSVFILLYFVIFVTLTVFKYLSLETAL